MNSVNPDDQPEADISAAELDQRVPEEQKSIVESERAVVAAVDRASDAQPSNEAKGVKKRRRRKKSESDEQRLLGRRSICKSASEIAPLMLKTVKMRVLARHLDSKRGMDDSKLTTLLVHESEKIVGHDVVVERLTEPDSDVHRRNLKDIILNVILLQEETYSLEERKLDDRVLEYERDIIESAKTLDLFDSDCHDPQRAHNCDTYRVVLDAAWRNNEDISLDEAELLRVLRERLDISGEDHRLISTYIKRFPKTDCALHTRDEIHAARKELQRSGLLWSYRDETSGNIDVIPLEVADVLRNGVHNLQLQQTNKRRLLQHDCLVLPELREILNEHNLDRTGPKADLIERLVRSDVSPTVVLDAVDRAKLSDMCRVVGLKTSGKKNELCDRLIAFYDDLTFEERETQDDREEWYNNFELLANRAYSDLRAKKIITKDLDVEHQFEKATDYLFEVLLNLDIDTERKVSKADGRLLLPERQTILWDCKSVEKAVNIQDHLEGQFDGYLRRERQKGFVPLAMLVIGPGFTPNSIKVAHQYKARTNWDVALVCADALKHVAEHWTATGTELAFPIRLFNRTEIIDVDRAEFLLSLA